MIDKMESLQKKIGLRSMLVRLASDLAFSYPERWSDLTK